MKQKPSLYFLKFALIIIVIFLVVPSHAHATVPVWDEALSGPIPPFIPAIGAGGILTESGWDVNKEFNITSLSIGSITARLIPSWDQVAYFLANRVLSILKDETLAWIKNGFEGRPQFLQDPEQFFTDIGDQATGIFIQDLGASLGDPQFFCKPNFGLQFQLDFGTYGRRPYDGLRGRAKCTLTQVINNVDDFYNDFENGNWEAFVKIRERRNNPLGSYLMAYNEMQSRREQSETVFQLSAEAGGGYLPTLRCADGQTTALGCRKFSIQSPAKAIGDRVAETIGLDYKQVLTADEVSEVVEALINLAIQTAVKKLAD